MVHIRSNRVRIAGGGTGFPLPSPESWHKDAACSGMDPSQFEIPEKGVGGSLTPAEQTSLAKARLVCNGCPVKKECLESSSPEDREFTVRGGLSPTKYKVNSKLRVGRGKCLHGHDYSVTGVIDEGYGRGQRCAECRHNHSKSRYEGGKTTPGYKLVKNPGSGRTYVTAPLTAAEQAAGQCVQGHEIVSPGAVSATGRCQSCVDHIAAEGARRRARERAEREKAKRDASWNRGTELMASGKMGG